MPKNFIKLLLVVTLTGVGILGILNRDTVAGTFGPLFIFNKFTATAASSATYQDVQGDVQISGNTTITGNTAISGKLSVGGTETGTANQDIKAYIQKVMCENRRGVWVDGTGCQEYAYYTSQCQYNSCSCNSGYHLCRFVDLFTGGFASLRRPGYNITTSYGWVGGVYPSYENKFFFPWGPGNNTNGDLTCAAGTHYMIDMRRNANGYPAWGCYSDTHTDASAMCCRDNQ